jgi:hypothetical protein
MSASNRSRTTLRSVSASINRAFCTASAACDATVDSSSRSSAPNVWFPWEKQRNSPTARSETRMGATSAVRACGTIASNAANDSRCSRRASTVADVAPSARAQWPSAGTAAGGLGLISCSRDQSVSRPRWVPSSSSVSTAQWSAPSNGPVVEASRCSICRSDDVWATA